MTATNMMLDRKMHTAHVVRTLSLCAFRTRWGRGKRGRALFSIRGIVSRLWSEIMLVSTSQTTNSAAGPLLMCTPRREQRPLCRPLNERRASHGATTTYVIVISLRYVPCFRCLQRQSAEERKEYGTEPHRLAPVQAGLLEWLQLHLEHIGHEDHEGARACIRHP